MLVLHSRSGKLATKHFTRSLDGSLAVESYGLERYWRPKPYDVRGFADMAALLNTLLDQPDALVVRGALRDGVDREGPIRRLSNGSRATIMDAPSRLLHLDIDKVSSSEFDVVKRPEQARDNVIDLLAAAAPDLSGAACWASWSSSAGVADVRRVKLHLWYLVEQPVTCADAKVWGKAVNARAGFPLVDLALFQPVQANYVARPLFVGMDDPFPGTSRAVTIPGRSPVLNIPVAPAIMAAEPRRARQGGFGGSSAPSIDVAIATMGEAADGFHGPWLRALSIFYAQNGPDADPRPLIIKLVRAIKRHGTRDAKYVDAEMRGMIRRARVLAERERNSHAAITKVRNALVARGHSTEA
jgi:hypothetical protein